MKRILSGIAALVLSLSMFGMTIFADDLAESAASSSDRADGNTADSKPVYDQNGNLRENTYQTADGFIYGIEENGSCRVIDYVGKEADLVIPKKLDGHKVTSVSSYFEDDYDHAKAFNDRDGLKSVTILADIEYIYCNSFSGCDNLRKVVLPDSVKTIYRWSFMDCPNLGSINIPKDLEFMGDCFARGSKWLAKKEKSEKLVVICGNLISGKTASGVVKLPAKVKMISAYAFADNKTMTELVIPASFGDGYMGAGAISDCAKLKKISIQNGVKGNLWYASVYSCPALRKVMLPPSLSKNGTEAMIWTVDNRAAYYYYKGTAAEKVLKEYQKRFDWLKTSVMPGKTSKLKVTALRKRVKVDWKPISTASGYQIQIAADSKFKKNCRTFTLAGGSRKSRTFTSVKSGRKYYIRQRSYRIVGGKRYYGNFTKARAVRVK